MESAMLLQTTYCLVVLPSTIKRESEQAQKKLLNKLWSHGNINPYLNILFLIINSWKLPLGTIIFDFLNDLILWIHPRIFETVVEVEDAFNETIVEADGIICNKLTVLEYERCEHVF